MPEREVVRLDPPGITPDVTEDVVSSRRGILRHIVAWARRRLMDDPTGSFLLGERGMRMGLILSLLALFLTSAVIGLNPALTLALVMPGILLYPLARSPAYWLAISCVALIGLFPVESADNHIFLMFYWCLAIGVALCFREARDVLAMNARLLVGLCFAFAVLWKIMAPEFLPGAFFQFTFAADNRFFQISQLFLGFTAESTAENVRNVAVLTHPTHRAASLPLQIPASAASAAQLLAWWTVVLEGAIAVTFLAPTSTRASRWRDIPLLVFMVTTYPVATVGAFAALLAAMGFVQSDRGNWRFRLAYLLLYLLVPFLVIARHISVYGCCALGR